MHNFCPCVLVSGVAGDATETISAFALDRLGNGGYFIVNRLPTLASIHWTVCVFVCVCSLVTRLYTSEDQFEGLCSLTLAPFFAIILRLRSARLRWSRLGGRSLDVVDFRVWFCDYECSLEIGHVGALILSRLVVEVRL